MIKRNEIDIEGKLKTSLFYFYFNLLFLHIVIQNHRLINFYIFIVGIFCNLILFTENEKINENDLL